MIDNEFIKKKYRTNVIFFILGIAFAALTVYIYGIHQDALARNGNIDSTKLIAVIMCFCGLFAFLFLLIGVTGVIGFKKGEKRLSDFDKELIAAELENPQTIFIRQCNIYLTPRYLIYADTGFEAIPYKDILWAYKFVQRHYLIPITTNIRIYTKNHKQRAVGNMSIIVMHKDQIINRIFSVIGEKNPEAKFGFSHELQAYFYRMKKADKKEEKGANI